MPARPAARRRAAAASARRVALVALPLVLLAGSAAARPAQCWTSDDGGYPCDFQPFGGDGSFTVTGPGVPAYTLNMTDRGVAEAVINENGHGIALPGPFIRAVDDPACWDSEATGSRICVH